MFSPWDAEEDSDIFVICYVVHKKITDLLTPGKKWLSGLMETVLMSSYYLRCHLVVYFDSLTVY